MDSWINPNENVLRMRLTEVRYANDFIKFGRIKFNTPQSWVDYAIKHGAGRGDFYEGTLAFCNMTDIEKIAEFNNKYINTLSAHYRPVIRTLFNDRLLYKDERSMNLPCYCLYILKLEAFSVPNGTGKQISTASIDGSYFKDFVDNLTIEHVEHKPEDEQPALIVIRDFGAFKSRLTKALNNIGVEEKDILINYTKYENFDKYGHIGWNDFGKKYPEELFIKSKRFEKQSEGRVIINTKDSKVLQRLEKPIDLGCMADIASVTKGYYPDGFTVKLNGIFYEA